MLDIIRQLPRVREARKLWLMLYLLKALLAFLLVLPFLFTVNADLARSAFAKTLMTGWDISVILELFGNAGELLPAFILMILAGTLVYMTIIQFLNGGVYYVIVSGHTSPINWREFFAECGACFLLHVKITLLMLLVYILLFSSSMFVVSLFGATGQNLMGTAALIMLLGKLLIVFLILLAASVFSDSARATVAAYPDRPFREILKTASTYFKPGFAALTGAYIITYLPFFILWALVEWLALKATGEIGGLVGIFLEFILFQLAAAVRTGQKLWFLFYLGQDFRKTNQGRFLPKQIELNLDAR
ncbi:MAG: hypothetical protein JW763_10745 [candidate division Zixibacteria bacterium]|nr:hypothetical protein [candidate division Zixibacteria bacterium]